MYIYIYTYIQVLLKALSYTSLCLRSEGRVEGRAAKAGPSTVLMPVPLTPSSPVPATRMSVLLHLFCTSFSMRANAKLYSTACSFACLFFLARNSRWYSTYTLMTSDSTLRQPIFGSHPFCTPALVKGPLPKGLGEAIRSGTLGSHAPASYFDMIDFL